MVGSLMVAVAMAISPQEQPPTLEQIRAVHASGDTDRARAMAENALRQDPSSYEATMLLADIQFQRPVIGRYPALALYREAHSLEPDSLDPLYGIVKVGRFLGSDEGETIARNAIYRIWALDPDYRDTWDLWEQFYAGEAQNRRAVEILSRYADRSDIRMRIASLFLNLNDYTEADSIARILQSTGERVAATWAVRAEVAFSRGDVRAGTEYLFVAIDSSASDSTGFLFRQVASIISPSETEEYERTPPRDRPAFWRAFWNSREPDLTTEGNERIAEHFARLRRARDQFRLRHPFGTVAHDRTGEGGVQLGLGGDWDFLGSDSLSRYRRLGMDGRGVTFMRYGEPRVRFKDSGREAWNYEIDGVSAWITMAIDHGDFLVRPVDAPFHRFAVGPTPGHPVFHDFANVLEFDRSSILPDMELDLWAAQFRAQSGSTSVYIRTEPDGAHARLWNREWGIQDSVSGVGILEMRSAGGPSHLGVDHRAQDGFGTVRGDILVHAFPEGSLKMSSLLVVPGAHPVIDRDAALRLMPADLRFETDSAITLYTEIYFLRANPRGQFVYDVQYRFVPAGDPDDSEIVTFDYGIETAALPVTTQSVVIDPGRISRGEYDVVIEVSDRVTGRVTLVSRLEIVFH